MKRIGILSGGGDAPGLNAVIRAVVKTARQHGDEVIGILDGYEGILDGRWRALDDADVADILALGGTILGAANRGNPLGRKILQDGREVVVSVVDSFLEEFARLALDALVVVGGDGSLRVGLQLFEKGVPVVGVPKTIDNDLGGTDVTFGFDTALQTATEAIDKLRTTAEAHRRVMVLELMGRDAGFITLHSGVAGGADVILIPEIPFDLEVVRYAIELRPGRAQDYSIIACAEGARPKGGEQVFACAGDALTSARLGGMGQRVASWVESSCAMEARCTVLGHLQRGGPPSPFDRWLATRYGGGAVRAVQAGSFGHMVALRGTQIALVPLAEALAVPKRVDPEGEPVRTARDLGIVFG